jgi:hypothetical protein
MATLNLLRCELCRGCKPTELMLGIIPKHEIEVVSPNEGVTHICKRCVENIRVSAVEAGVLAERVKNAIH